jgi:outer membrane protein OmpA-like peptidoglycan-associated protein
MKSFFSLFLLFFTFTTYAQEQFVVYFDSDQFELTSKESKKLEDWMAVHLKDKVVAINGYTDEDGSSAYNDTLAKKRVDFVFNIIKENVPFRADFKSRSFGENFNQEKDKAKNRKVTIYFIEEKDLKRENEILGIEENEIAVDTSTTEIVEVEEVIDDNAPLQDKIIKTKVGKTVIIENINFHYNSFAVMNESRPVMYELLDIMRKYPRLVIQIQGHVCCNTNPEDKYSLKLSKERAKAMKLFLVANGIPAQRVSFEGFGASKPRFAIPEKDESERKANRRVEILIVNK